MFAKNKKELENLIQVVRIQWRYRGEIWPGKMSYANNKKRKTTNDRRNIKTKLKKKSERSEKKKTYKHLGILEAVIIKQVEMKEKYKKVYSRRTRKLLDTKLYSRNLIKGNKRLAKILGIVLKVDEGRTTVNRPENKTTSDDS